MRTSKLLTLSCLLTVLLAPGLSGGEEFLLYAPKPAAGDQVPASPDEGVLVRSVTVKRGDTLADLARKHIGTASWFPQVLLFNTIKNPDLIYPGEKLLIPVNGGHNPSLKKSAKSAKAAKRAKGKRRHPASAPAPAKPSAEQPATAVAPAVLAPEKAAPAKAAPTKAAPAKAAPEKATPAAPAKATPATPAKATPATPAKATPAKAASEKAASTKAASTNASSTKASSAKAASAKAAPAAGVIERQSYQRAKRAYLAGDYQKAQNLFARFLRYFPNSNLAPDASLYQADCYLQLSGQ